MASPTFTVFRHGGIVVAHQSGGAIPAVGESFIITTETREILTEVESRTWSPLGTMPDHADGKPVERATGPLGLQCSVELSPGFSQRRPARSS